MAKIVWVVRCVRCKKDEAFEGTEYSDVRRRVDQRFRSGANKALRGIEYTHREECRE
jgi:hypothetical protein